MVLDSLRGVLGGFMVDVAGGSRKSQDISERFQKVTGAPGSVMGVSEALRSFLGVTGGLRGFQEILDTALELPKPL